MHALKPGRMHTLKAVTVTRASCHPVPYRDDAIKERRRGGEEERREAAPIARGGEPERRASEGERRGSERGSGRGGLGVWQLVAGRDTCY
jgi:hypothetical protein